MRTDSELPAEAYAAILSRDKAMRRALEEFQNSRGPKEWEIWATLAHAAVLVLIVYFATKDLFVALASAAGLAAWNLARTNHRETRKQRAALAALVELVLETRGAEGVTRELEQASSPAEGHR
jgi:Flp pilus assembly protein TadB